MQYNTHMLVGYAFGIGLAMTDVLIPENDYKEAAKFAIILGSTIGGLVPDIDHENSKITKHLFLVHFLLEVPNLIFKDLATNAKRKGKKKTESFFQWWSDFFGHRGVCHWGLLWLALTAWVYFLVQPSDSNIHFLGMCCYGICWGSISHLVADTLNPSGIPWIIPSKKCRISIAKIRTGESGETVFRAVMVVACIALTIFCIKCNFSVSNALLAIIQ